MITHYFVRFLIETDTMVAIGQLAWSLDDPTRTTRQAQCIAFGFPWKFQIAFRGLLIPRKTSSLLRWRTLCFTDQTWSFNWRMCRYA